MKGRGAGSNPTGRFEKRKHVPLEPEDALDPEWTPPVPRTEVIPETTRTILTTNDSPDVPFDRSINPYKGCEHGCVYCFARPTHAYLGLSPGLDFESKIFSKPEAPALLRNELSRRGYRPQLIALGANTDPYQPVERELGITRGILEVLAEHKHPVSIVTKSHLVLRDLDILREMAREELASVFVSITTLDPELARRMEPRAATPVRRLETLRALSEAGVPVGALASPMIPGLNDADLERILEAAAEAGACSAGYVLVRLPHEVKELFEEWLHTHYPTRAAHVLHLVRECRGGELYDASFGSRMRGTGPVAELIERRFTIACRRLGLTRRPTHDTTRFRAPQGSQKTLFS
jgi:DNA repair photolyase